MTATKKVEDRLPGLRFHGVDAAIRGTSIPGHWVGTITMQCDIYDKELWRVAVDKLECLKVFSSTADELMDALGYELDKTAASLQQAEREKEDLLLVIASKDAEIAELREFLRQVGQGVGIE